MQVDPTSDLLSILNSGALDPGYPTADHPPGLLAKAKKWQLQVVETPRDKEFRPLHGCDCFRLLLFDGSDSISLPSDCQI